MDYQLLPNDIFPQIIRAVNDWRTWCACYCVNKYWYANAQNIEEWKLDEFTVPDLNRSQGDAICNGILPNGIAHGKFVDYGNRAYPSIGRFFRGKKHGLELRDDSMCIWDHGDLFIYMNFHAYINRYIYVYFDKFTMFFDISPSGNKLLHILGHEALEESWYVQKIPTNHLRNFYISLYDMWIYIKNLFFALYA